jgi:outer membrane receptor protein involved in Fe transport
MGEDVVVTATRGPRARRDVPAAVTVVGREEIDRSPTKTVDELLRSAPSFTLFRRSSSVAADPSAQGVKLRNVGASGVSRTLVLVDGIPANDPFGGWVAWRAIPRIGLQRIEVVPGGGSALYGNYALGGVVQAFSRPIGPSEADVTAEYGSFNTAQADLWLADRQGPLAAALEGELFTSKGYPVVAEKSRGAIDGDTPTKHGTVRGRLEAAATPRLAFDARGGWFYEELNGGTRYTTAMVRRFEYAAGAHYAPEAAGALDLSLFGHHGDFKQDRARVGAGRRSEERSAHQDVPTDDVGLSLVYRSPILELGGRHTLTVGADARSIEGTTLEGLFPATSPPAAAPASTTVVQRDAKGRQRPYGVFFQDLYDLTEALGASLALRYDRWSNEAGSRVERTLGGTSTATPFADRSGGQLSPKLGLRARLTEWLSARAAAYQSFRAPTLDELYRPFQVGTIRTGANEDLNPEKLRGVEGGVDLGASRRTRARLTGFWSELEDPIVNVTLQAGDPAIDKPGGPYQRERRNLGKARIQGLEADGSWGFAPSWTVSGAYTLADAQVTAAPGQAQLVGKQLPQAPRHLARLAVDFDDPRVLTGSVQLRYLGKQYEDDVNTLAMGDALLLDLFACWHATRRLDLYIAVENAFDKVYLVGRAGVDTVGQPRFVHGGLRLQVGD